MAYKDPERGRAYGREWMKRNPEKAREAMRRWRARNPELNRVRDREYRRAAHARRGAEIAAIKKAWLDAHPEVRRAKDQGYRARKRAAPGSFTGAEWRALVEQYAGACGYCGAKGPLDADHRIPLSRGGDNTIGNIIPACHSCNVRKHRMTEQEFRARIASERSDDLKS
ncbi:MAG: HNH endonuclease [Chloroflexi bacterium]|nr:MAG: HNH endonuclease [Chloroflexota bacterium]